MLTGEMEKNKKRANNEENALHNPPQQIPKYNLQISNKLQTVQFSKFQKIKNI